MYAEMNAKNDEMNAKNDEMKTRLKTLKGNTVGVECLIYHKNKLYSGSWDKIIRIWDTDTREEIAHLMGHTNSVSCLTIHENKLYSGGEFPDNTIRVWNI